MNYLYAEKRNLEAFASGNALIHFGGMPNFPVRLNIELFERAYRLIGREKISVYDPCCGNGYSLTTLGFAENDKISFLRGSDIDEKCVEAANANLSLLSAEGIARRVARLRGDAESNRAENDSIKTERAKSDSTETKRAENDSAGSNRGETNGIAACLRLSELLAHEVDAHAYRQDILTGAPAFIEGTPDYIFADIPYGRMTEWSAPEFSPVERMLDSLCGLMSGETVLAVAGDKGLRLNGGRFKRLDRLSVGRRLVYILKKA